MDNMQKDIMVPALYVVATPIGNLADISLRALDVLRAADTVACEDTRHARHLLDHHGIKAPLLAVHQHNEQQAAAKLIETIDDLLTGLGGEREIVIARELTKLFEQIVRLPLADAPAWLAADSNHQRGEFVLIVAGPAPREGLDAEAERVLKTLLAELPTKQAAKLAAEITGVGKNELYQRALALKNETL
jgi:16S rRNA C1402 (ribose-2'-O) methylase RsmI